MPVPPLPFDDIRKKQAITLIVKITSGCNFLCRYCDADIYSNKIMSTTVLESLVKNTLLTQRNVQFIWHGGEPLIAGLDFFKTAIKLQRQFASKGQIITNSIQTNGSLLTKQWVDFFKDNKFSVGISIDGPSILHDLNRVYKNGSATHDSVTRGIQLIKEAGMKFGTISVITKDTEKLGAEEFLNFFIRNGISSMALNMQNPALNVGREDEVGVDGYSKFLIDLFDIWYKNNDPTIRIREFNAIIRGFLYKKPNFCILAGNCFGRYFAIDTHGRAYHCDEFMFDSNYLLGDVTSTPFEDIITNEKMQKLIDENNNDLSKSECKWSKICNGGCPKRRYVMKRAMKTIPTCCGWSKVISHIHSKLIEDRRLDEHIIKIMSN